MFLRSPNGGCCSISDDLCCSCTLRKRSLLDCLNLILQELKPEEVWFSYFICIFLVTRHFPWYYILSEIGKITHISKSYTVRITV